MMEKYLKKYNKRPFILIFLKSMCFLPQMFHFEQTKSQIIKENIVRSHLYYHNLFMTYGECPGNPNSNWTTRSN